jgi:TetR/AcrR family transcriptional regulator, mexCD-oprJ operon repressor
MMSEAAHRLRPREALHQRVSAAILDAAARVVAEQGTQASMTDVATAAGVARATVYRYFPSREALLADLARAALADAAARLATARINEVPAEEGIKRAVRALLEVGDYFVVLVRERTSPERAALDAQVASPLRHLFESAQRSGAVRRDVPPSLLTESLVALAAGVPRAAPALGKEDQIAAIATLFLDGARARDEI